MHIYENKTDKEINLIVINKCNKKAWKKKSESFVNFLNTHAFLYIDRTHSLSISLPLSHTFSVTTNNLWFFFFYLLTLSTTHLVRNSHRNSIDSFTIFVLIRSSIQIYNALLFLHLRFRSNVSHYVCEVITVLSIWICYLIYPLINLSDIYV
jgi:hypothetical protein